MSRYEIPLDDKVDANVEAQPMGYVYDGSETEPAAVREEEVVHSNRLFRALNKLFDKGVEARGIERVPEDERDNTHSMGLLLLWWSVNMVVSTLPVGVSPLSSSCVMGCGSDD